VWVVEFGVGLGVAPRLHSYGLEIKRLLRRTLLTTAQPRNVTLPPL
jgi:hypothetical protein